MLQIKRERGCWTVRCGRQVLYRGRRRKAAVKMMCIALRF